VRSTVVPSPPKLFDELPGGPPAGGIQPGRRLVQEQQLGLADEAKPHVQPALLAAGQRLDPGAGLLCQSHHVQHLVDRAGMRVEPRTAGEHLAHRQEGLDGEFLQHDAHLRPQPALRPAGARVDAEHLDDPGVPAPEALEYLDRGGLARAVRAEQGEDLARLDLEAYVGHGRQRTVGLAEIFHADSRPCVLPHFPDCSIPGQNRDTQFDRSRLQGGWW
jgi:hypothetical protein